MDKKNGSFLERLKSLMKNEGIKTQYELHKRLKFRPSVINAWFIGKVKCPRESTLEVIASYFNVSKSWLRYGEERLKPTLTNRAEGFAKKLERYPELLDQMFSIAEALIPQYEKRRIEKLGKDTSVQKKKHRKVAERKV